MSVIVCFHNSIRINRKVEHSVVDDIVIVSLGLVSLTFRQTNIFWVSVFPAAILVVSRIDVGSKDTSDEECLLDPPVHEATADGNRFSRFMYLITC